MRRLLIIFLLSILSYQSAWATAAVYCPDEASKSVQHFGHHQHIDESGGSGTDAKGQLHKECGVCHAIGWQAVLSGALTIAAGHTAFATFLTTLARPASAPSSLPERPQWLRLA
jgi:hypothetical protein